MPVKSEDKDGQGSMDPPGASRGASRTANDKDGDRNDSAASRSSPQSAPSDSSRSISGSPAQFTRSHSRAQQQKALQQQQQQQHHVAPHIVNSRPPSAASNSSGNGPPRTTTSRRGGRTRSRSPPNNAMMGAPPGAQAESFANGPPQSPANPSAAAAAAAAAAAKSLSSNPPGGSAPPSSWYGGDPSKYPHAGRPGPPGPPSHHPHQHQFPPGHHPYSQSHPHHPGSQHRPPSSQQYAQTPSRYDRDAHSTSSAATTRHANTPRNWASPSRNRGGALAGYRPTEDQYGYRGGAGGGNVPAVPDHRHAPSPYPGGDRRDPREDGSTSGYHGGGPYDYKRRYGDPQHPHYRQHASYPPQDDRSVHSTRRGPPTSPIPPPSAAPAGYYGDPYAHGHHPQHGPPPPQQRHDPNGPYYDGKYGKPPPQQPQRRTGTTRVIGTATPIHIARGAEDGGQRIDNRESVFRGRPKVDQGKPEAAGDSPSPEKVLLSLRTPTSSFDAENPTSPGAQTNLQPVNSTLGAEATTLLFDPHRSPKGQSQAGAGAIDTAPSFSLFNQSFDSFGDSAQYFNGPLDSTLHSTSFGVGPTASMVDPEHLPKAGSSAENELRINRSMSGGIYTQQLLSGTGSGGAFTFGMSPNNSFGGVAPAPNAPPGTGNMMLFGSSASNEMMGGVYQSYSGGVSPRLNKAIMDSASFGGPAISQAYSRSFANGSQYVTNSYGAPPPQSDDDGEDDDGHSPKFYNFLRRHRAAFKECTFLLPGLKAALLEAPETSPAGGGSKSKKMQEGRDESDNSAATKTEGDVDKTKSDTIPGNSQAPHNHLGDPSSQDISVALRRVASAVCAFGGTIMGDRASAPPPQPKSNSQSIFREKDGDTATVTPSSSTTSPPAPRYQTRQRLKYDESLSSRYYENENRLSWEFEDNPPVEEMKREEHEAAAAAAAARKSSKEDGGENQNRGDGKEKHGSNSNDDDDNEGDESKDEKKDSSSGQNADQPKMRYRCKLCGQPKQNHVCPYRQSLARSIGIMVYPALNAYTSAEPGYYAPNLSDMNNFVASSADSVSSAEGSPSRPTPERIRRMSQSGAGGHVPNQVTPEALRGMSRGSGSPVSSMSAAGAAVTPQRGRSSASVSMTPASSRHKRGPASPASSSRRKRPRMYTGGHEELLFVESMDLRPEQFRIVSNSTALSNPDAFTYPSLPLPYAQRKRLSDNLFSLSKQVNFLTEECAAVLRQARRAKADLWDLAVAELLTQVVVVVKCHEQDSRFDGLQQYLLWLGIAC